MKSLEEARLFLLDMDGTFYLEDTLLPGAREFLAWCKKRGSAYMFLTNNSSKSSGAYREKLAGLGISVAPGEIMTSGDATLQYLQEQGASRALLLIGTPSLEADFRAAGYETDAAAPEAVVLGFDTTLTYPKLAKLCDAVRAGLPYIATHPDLNCPVQGGYIPDIGAVIAFVQAATGRKPDLVVGKPNAAIARAAARRHGLPLEALCMVGDRLYTDIALGTCGVGTALVLCGESSREDLALSPFTPDFVFENLLDLVERADS